MGPRAGWGRSLAWDRIEKPFACPWQCYFRSVAAWRVTRLRPELTQQASRGESGRLCEHRPPGLDTVAASGCALLSPLLALPPPSPPWVVQRGVCVRLGGSQAGRGTVRSSVVVFTLGSRQHERDRRPELILAQGLAMRRAAESPG